MGARERAVTPRPLSPGGVTPGSLIGYLVWPHRPTLVFSVHFVLTHAHPVPTYQSVTHPRIALGQSRITLEFFLNELPEKKLQLVGMSILSILLIHVLGYHIHPPFTRSMPSAIKHTPGTFPLGTRMCIQC